MKIKIYKNNCSNEKYPCYEQGHIRNLQNIAEIKKISFKNIYEINELLKSGWIYITVFEDFSLLLGRPRM